MIYQTFLIIDLPTPKNFQNLSSTTKKLLIFWRPLVVLIGLQEILEFFSKNLKPPEFNY